MLYRLKSCLVELGCELCYTESPVAFMLSHVLLQKV